MRCPVRWVYFGERRGLIKIGCSQNPLRRVRNLGCTVLLGATPGQFRDERAMHGRFGEHRVRGEWFVDVPAIRGYALSLPPLDGLPDSWHMQHRAALAAFDAERAEELAAALVAKPASLSDLPLGDIFGWAFDPVGQHRRQLLAAVLGTDPYAIEPAPSSAVPDSPSAAVEPGPPIEVPAERVAS
jgi:hypothetical protein